LLFQQLSCQHFDVLFPLLAFQGVSPNKDDCPPLMSGCHPKIKAGKKIFAFAKWGENR